MRSYSTGSTLTVVSSSTADAFAVKWNFNSAIGKTIYAIDAFVDGDMDDIIDPLIYADQQEQLRALGQGEWQRG